jgi:hypothetical protein
MCSRARPRAQGAAVRAASSRYLEHTPRCDGAGHDLPSIAERGDVSSPRGASSSKPAVDRPPLYLGPTSTECHDRGAAGPSVIDPVPKTDESHVRLGDPCAARVVPRATLERLLAAWSLTRPLPGVDPLAASRNRRGARVPEAVSSCEWRTPRARSISAIGGRLAAWKARRRGSAGRPRLGRAPRRRRAAAAVGRS